MDENKRCKIEAVFDSPQYGQVACAIHIDDFAAVARFSDKRLGKDMFEAEKKQGNKNISWDERRGFLIEKYPDKTKDKIAKEIIKKFEEHNVYVKSKQNTD